MPEKRSNDPRTNEPRLSRWPSGPQVSLGSLLSTGSFIAVFIGLSFLMDNRFILYLAMCLFAISALIRVSRGKSLAGLFTHGEDFWDDYEIKANRVFCTKNGVGWQEDLANYQEVMWRVETIRRRHRVGRRRRRDDVFQILELRHTRNRSLDINIYTSLEAKGMRARWQEAAIAFNLPASRDMGDGVILRKDVKDIGKPLRTLANSRTLKAKVNTSLPPPSGVRWVARDDKLCIHFRKAIVPYILVALPSFLLAVFVGIMVPADAMLTSTVIAVPCAVFALWLLVSYRVKITPEAILVYRLLGPLPLWYHSIALREVEEILTGPALLSWAAVLVESGDRVLRLHPLSDPVAKWLQQFLHLAITTAPRR